MPVLFLGIIKNEIPKMATIPVPFRIQEKCREDIPCGVTTWCKLIRDGYIPNPVPAYPGSRVKGFPEDQWAEILSNLRARAIKKGPGKLGGVFRTSRGAAA